MSLTAAILACNNEANITGCLESIVWADEMLVILDTRSRDRTDEIARGLGARVLPHPFEHFAAQRNYALEQALSDWVFFLDTDERLTPALSAEIRSTIVAEPAAVGWWVPRHNHIWNRIIHHGGWYPDYQLRLIKRGYGRYDPERPVHEVVILDGAQGWLQQPLIHYNYHTLQQFIGKQRQYIAYEAEIRYRQGIRPKPWTWLSLSMREFARRYVTLQGYRDGWRGLVLCGLVAYYYGFAATRLLAQRLRRER